jgi:hypothetical protein
MDQHIGSEEGAREKFQNDRNHPSSKRIGGSRSGVFVEPDTGKFARSRGENSRKEKS